MLKYLGLVLVGLLSAVACFEFDGYSFPEGTGGSQAAVSGMGGNQPAPGVGGQVSNGGSPFVPGNGGSAGSCNEGPSCLDVRLPGQLGASCEAASACDSGFCVDGVCCDSACTGTCADCNVPDSEGSCTMPASDASCTAAACPADTACISYGSAQGGNCSAIGACRPVLDCAATPHPDADCSNANNEVGKCGSQGECIIFNKKRLGEACAAGDECGSTFCAPGALGALVCCDAACNGTCQQCNASGACMEFPPNDPTCPTASCPADTLCSDYPDSISEQRCSGPGICQGAEACGVTALRPAADCAASGKLRQGATCTANAQCDSNVCDDGVCCNRLCNGTCERCAANTGICGQVANCQCTAGTQSTCGAALQSVGACAGLSVTCGTDGRWPVAQCNARSAELCENGARVDDDCDGQFNEGCECENGNFSNCRIRVPASRGICADRQLTCTNGRYPTEQCAPRTTDREICGNNLDDDCDGTVNEVSECPPRFDPRNCNFARPNCESINCNIDPVCGGCQECFDIIDCVSRTNPTCITQADPTCKGTEANPGACFDVSFSEPGESGTFASVARRFIECSCTQ
jgi:hypothetical protein